MKDKKREEKNEASQINGKSTSVNIDSRASRVPFPLHDEVIILVFTGRTRTSAEAEHEK